MRCRSQPRLVLSRLTIDIESAKGATKHLVLDYGYGHSFLS